MNKGLSYAGFLSMTMKLSLMSVINDFWPCDILPFTGQSFESENNGLDWIWSGNT